MTRLLAADDLYALVHAEEPRLSPDGTRIAYVQVEIDRATYAYRRSLYLVAAAGTSATAGPPQPRRLTTGPKDSAPQWSPDGRSLAFVRAPDEKVKPTDEAQRERGVGKPQLYVLPMDGGEPRQLTTLRHGVGAPVWSPDGRSIAFAAETGAPDDAEADDAALHGKTLPRVRTITQLWHRLDGHGYIYELRSHIFTVAVEGGAPRQLTDGDWNDGAPTWSPDGGSIAFTSDRSEQRWVWPGDSIWLAPTTGEGARVRLTDETLACQAPSWSPDGAQIAFLAAPRRRSGGHVDLYVVSAATATDSGAPTEPRCLSTEFVPICADGCIDDQRAGHGGAHLDWSSDGRDIYFLASMRGTTHVYVAPASGQRLPRRVTDGLCRVYDFAMDDARRNLALAVADSSQPGDLYFQELSSGEQVAQRQRLTALNAALLDEIELAQPEDLSFHGADDWEIQGWVLRPARARAAERVPAILQIHGGPAAMYGYSFFFEFQLLAAQGYAVVYSNPRGSVGYGRDFSHAVLDDWGGKDHQDVMAGLEAALRRGDLDADRLGVAGGSYGGFMTNWIVGQTDRFKAGVTMRSVTNMATMFGTSDIGWELAVDQLSTTPWEDLDRLMRFSPIRFVANIHTPLLILHSDNDLRCPIGEGEQLYSALAYLGRETKMVRFEGQSHDLSRSGHPRSRVRRLNEIIGWFQQHIG